MNEKPSRNPSQMAESSQEDSRKCSVICKTILSPGDDTGSSKQKCGSEWVFIRVDYAALDFILIQPD